MAPVPLDGNQTPIGGNMIQESAKGGSISLGLLMDFIIQRTYHELTVLAELLPRKTDMERKIEIFNYANRTRQLFIRLMALVKWANSASKVDKSTRIMGFLDKQAMLFIDTADLLARIARETVVRARLPNFHIPAAVEVLTTGSYSTVPSCVKDRIVPSEPITASERRSVLLKLNQVIQHRLVSSELLPQMRNLKIENGRVTFHVENEFEVSLTIMGDGPLMPWRLLNISILVEDRETGEGKPLSHPLQVQYIQQILQARIADSADPLKEVYSFLHFFCQSLQLEVFFSQTIKLCRDRLDGHIAVDEYCQGKCLSVSYWRELTAKDPKSELGYTLTLLVDMNRPDRPLSIVHVPSLGCSETDMVEETISTDHLSMEKLLVHTIYIRTKNRLVELKKEIKSKVKGIQYTLQGTPAILSLSILIPCLRAEQLLVTVDTHTGMIQCHIPQYSSRYPPVVSELQHSFNTDRSNIPALISDIRFWLTKQRCMKTLQHLPVTVTEHLPIINDPTQSITLISKRRMFVTFHRHSNYILAVEMKEKLKSPSDMEYGFYLLEVKRTTIKENASNEPPCSENDAPKLYLKAFTKIQLDTFVITHGSFTSVIDAIPNKYAGLKRKNLIAVETTNKKAKHPAYFIPELAHVVALCDERIPFTTLAQELTKREIPHQGIQIEANATALSLKLVQLPPPEGISVTSPGWIALMKRLLSVSIRSIFKGNGHFWAVEFVMYGTPIATANSHSREQGMRRPVYFQYEMNSSESASKMVDSLMQDWSQIVHLYCLIEDMAEYLKLGKFDLTKIATVKSYNYSKFVICYGGSPPQRQATATFQWNANTKSFKILFGSMGNSSNAHLLVEEQLEDHLNRNKNLAQLIHILHETYPPLVSVNKLPSMPHIVYLTNPVTNPKPSLAPVITFVVIVQSPTVLRVVYQGTYCLELMLLSDGLISVRDGAYCRFDRTSAVSDYMPTGDLKAFLSKYEDQTLVLRRRSQLEDDDPPSPIRADSVDSPTSFLSHHRGPQSPIQRGEGGLRFHPPMTPPSNPHTPASPHTGNMQGNTSHQTFSSSPSTSFNMASPPALSSNINSSPSMLPHPSPGSGLLASSPSNPMHVLSPAGLMPTSSPGPCSSSIPVGHSPAGSFLTQGHTDGSPFTSAQSMTSPAAVNWPGSPGMPRPSPARAGQSPGGHSALHSPEQHKSVGQTSRILPQKPWAGAVPTLLSHEALDSLCTPSPHPQLLPGSELCPLERFLGCVSLRRQLQKSIKADKQAYKPTQNPEQGMLNFKVNGLQCLVCLNRNHFQSLHIKITVAPENKEPWSVEDPQDLQVLEKFFDMRVAAPPFKSHSVDMFAKLLTCQHHFLKDFIQIMKLDLIPSLVQQQGMKWMPQICLCVPPSAFPFVNKGVLAFHIHGTKILFFLQVTRVGLSYSTGDAPFLILPVLYETQYNLTQLVEKKGSPPTNALSLASLHIKRYGEYNKQPNKCSLFPTICDFLTNFSLPSDPPSQMIQTAGGQSPMMMSVPGGPQMNAPGDPLQGYSVGPMGM
ncbi:mediator of RNA polymerase II transcription subunit 14 [Planococcus citri]|uniref:mediator of RNA polymerase II transcription subunit 14 n=1 Tax=Planococcus citri TaxID=170843 RepID=UPI0031F86CDD